MKQSKYQKHLEKVKFENNLKEILTPVSAGTIISLFLSYYLCQYISTAIVIFWFFLLLLFGLLRLGVRKAYYADASKYSLSRWIRGYESVVCVVGFLWGAIPIITINQLPSEYLLIEFTLLLGMSAGGAISNISNKLVAIFYSHIIIVCHIIKILMEQNKYWESLILVELVFLGFLYKMISKFYEIYQNSIIMTFELKDKMRLEQELQKEKASKLQNAKLASLGEMAAGMSHEVNNPLTISIGKLKILIKMIKRETISTEDILKNLDAILNSNERITKIIQSMKSLSRMKEDVELEKINLKEIIKECVPLLQSRFNKGQVEFLDKSTDTFVLADRSEISQIVINLVKNAYDAISETKGERWIRIESYKHEDFVELRVLDSGNIVDESLGAKFFDPFFTTKEVGLGTGLGLSLCRSLMERNRGKIFLDTNEDNTCFVLCFPKID